MKYDPDIHNRRSIRLKGYDYSQKGAYYVTICAQDRLCLFGEILEGQLIPNDAGEKIKKTFLEIPETYPGIGIDAFIVMPNHIHGIIYVGAAPCGRPSPVQSGQPQGVAPTNAEQLSLPDIVHRFKSFTTHLYSKGVKENGWMPYPERLWQRNYFEHIVRDDDELEIIREYIIKNPSNWINDKENPTLCDVREFNDDLRLTEELEQNYKEPPTS